MGRFLHFLLILFLLPCLKVRAQAPAWQWARGANSSGTEYASDVACDTLYGNVYIGGKFNQTGNTYTLTSYGQDDGFIAKYTAAGVLRWAIKIGGTSDDEVKSVSVGPGGNVYVCGFFKGTADFDPSAATSNLTSSGDKDGFLAKYDTSGAFIWAVKFGGSKDDEPSKMYADANGVYLTGSNSSVATFFSTNGITRVTPAYTQPNNGNSDAFGAKYSTAGIIQWIITGTGDRIDYGTNVVADAVNVYFTGIYNSAITFAYPTGTPTSSIIPVFHNNRSHVYIVACTQSGAFRWQNNIVTTQSASRDIESKALAQDAVKLYVSGYMTGDIDFKSPGATFTQAISSNNKPDIYLAAIDKNNGNFLWRASNTGSGPDEEEGRALGIDNNGHIVLAGNFENTLNYGAGSPTLTASGGKDIFVASYSNSGTFRWATKAGGTGDDVCNGLSVDNTGGIYVAGGHTGNAVFGTYTLTAGMFDNIYVARTGCPIPDNTITTSQTVICAGDIISFTGSPPASVGTPTYVWQQGSNTTSWTNAAGIFTSQSYTSPPLNANTFYRRLVRSSCNNTLSNTILISVNPLSDRADAGPDVSVENSIVTLKANSPVNGTGRWRVTKGSGVLADSASAETNVSGLSKGVNTFYWLIKSGACSESYDSINVYWLFIPNAFSPNGDQMNDVFEIKGIEDYGNAELEVFNRWGALVYQHTSYNNTWSGTNMQGQALAEDTYYYTLKINQDKIYKGFIIIKRTK